MDLTKVELVGLGVAALALVLIIKNGNAVGQSIGSGAVDLVDGTITGAVVSTGEIFGIPATSANQCQADMAAGNKWAASFSCPAKTFIKFLFTGK